MASHYHLDCTFSRFKADTEVALACSKCCVELGFGTSYGQSYGVSSSRSQGSQCNNPLLE